MTSVVEGSGSVLGGREQWVICIQCILWQEMVDGSTAFSSVAVRYSLSEVFMFYSS